MKIPSYLTTPSEPIAAPRATVAAPPQGSLKTRVLDALRKVGQSRPLAVAKAAGLSHPTAHKELQKLIQLGLVERVPLTYRLTPQALQMLEEDGDWPVEALRMPRGQAKKVPKIGHKIQENPQD